MNQCHNHHKANLAQVFALASAFDFSLPPFLTRISNLNVPNVNRKEKSRIYGYPHRDANLPCSAGVKSLGVNLSINFRLVDAGPGW